MNKRVLNSGNQPFSFCVSNSNDSPALCARHDILATLSYFDIFKYPLTQTEIYLFLEKSYSAEEFYTALQNLKSESRIYKYDEFYSLRDNYQLVLRRRKGNLKARKMIETAEKIAKLLSYFPFVRGIAVSGSLSKNYADENSDIDFFIVTKKNRLWIARTTMHFFKKLSYLFKKEHLFCMNYYVDEDVLEIQERNIYTAIEIATLLPLRGIAAFQKFYAANAWSKELLPNHSMRISYVREMKKPWIKAIMEAILNPAGSLLDKWLMKMTAGRWLSKTKKQKLNKHGLVLNLHCNRHCAKPNPENFQNKLLHSYQQKLLHLSPYEERAQTIF